MVVGRAISGRGKAASLGSCKATSDEEHSSAAKRSSAVGAVSAAAVMWCQSIRAGNVIVCVVVCLCLQAWIETQKEFANMDASKRNVWIQVSHTHTAARGGGDTLHFGAAIVDVVLMWPTKNVFH